MKQTTFASLAYATKNKRTRREKFLAEMDAVVPWARLTALIEPHYPKAGAKGGRPPMPLEVMLRVYCIQQWYASSDPAAEEALYDSDPMRRFAGLELGYDAIPDETTILNFRHLLERHDLTRAIFEAVNDYLRERGILLREGLVDATLIDAPSLTKNKQRARDHEMTSTKKGNVWYFGMKAHVGVDIDSGVVHTLEASTARVHDSRKFDDLLHGDERSVFGDKGHVSGEREAAFRAQGKVWGVMRKAPKGGKLHPMDEHINRIIASMQAKVEHPFRVLKCQFSYRKTRYRGLAKNEAQLFSLSGLATCSWSDDG